MRILVATAVPAERDAVARALPGPGTDVRLPAATLHRFRTAGDVVPGSPPSGHVQGSPPTGPVYDLLAAGVGPALAAASTAAALTAAALDGRPYALVVST